MQSPEGERSFDWLLYAVEPNKEFKLDEFTNITSSEHSFLTDQISQAMPRGDTGSMEFSWKLVKSILQAPTDIVTCICRCQVRPGEIMHVVGYHDGVLTVSMKEHSTGYSGYGSVVMSMVAGVSSFGLYPTCLCQYDGPSVIVGTSTGQVFVWVIKAGPSNQGQMESELIPYRKVDGSLRWIFKAKVNESTTVVFLVTRTEVYKVIENQSLSQPKKLYEFQEILHCCMLGHDRLVVMGFRKEEEQQSGGFFACFFPSFFGRGASDGEVPPKKKVEVRVICGDGDQYDVTGTLGEHVAQRNTKADGHRFIGQMSPRELWVYCGEKLHALYFPEKLTSSHDVMSREIDLGSLRFQDCVDVVHGDDGYLWFLREADKCVRIKKTVADTITTLPAFCKNLDQSTLEVFSRCMIFLWKFSTRDSEKLCVQDVEKVRNYVKENKDKWQYYHYREQLNNFAQMCVYWADPAIEKFELPSQDMERLDENVLDVIISIWKAHCNKVKQNEQSLFDKIITSLTTKLKSENNRVLSEIISQEKRVEVTRDICKQLDEIYGVDQKDNDSKPSQRVSRAYLPASFVDFFRQHGFLDIFVLLKILLGDEESLGDNEEGAGYYVFLAVLKDSVRKETPSKKQKAKPREFVQLEPYQVNELQAFLPETENELWRNTLITCAYDLFLMADGNENRRTDLSTRLNVDSKLAQCCDSLTKTHVIDMLRGQHEQDSQDQLLDMGKLLALARMIVTLDAKQIADQPLFKWISNDRPTESISSIRKNLESNANVVPALIPIQALLNTVVDPQKSEKPGVYRDWAQLLDEYLPLYGFPESEKTRNHLLEKQTPSPDNRSDVDQLTDLILDLGFLDWQDRGKITDDAGNLDSALGKIFELWAGLDDEEKVTMCKELALPLLLIDEIPYKQNVARFRDFMIEQSRINSEQKSFLVEVWETCYESGRKESCLRNLLGKELWRKNIWYFIDKVGMPSGDQSLREAENFMKLFLKCFVLDKADTEQALQDNLGKIDGQVLECLKSYTGQSKTNAEPRNMEAESTVCQRFGLLKSRLFTLRHTPATRRIQVIVDPLKDSLNRLAGYYSHWNEYEAKRHEARIRDILQTAALMLKNFKGRQEERYMWVLSKVVLDQFEEPMKRTKDKPLSNEKDPLQQLFCSFALTMIDFMPKASALKQIIDRIERWSSAPADMSNRERARITVSSLHQYIYNEASTMRTVLGMAEQEEIRRTRQVAVRKGQAWSLGPQSLCAKCNRPLSIESKCYIRSWDCGHTFHDNDVCVPAGTLLCPICCPHLAHKRVPEEEGTEQQDPTSQFYMQKLSPLANVSPPTVNQMTNTFALLEFVAGEYPTPRYTNTDLTRWLNRDIIDNCLEGDPRSVQKVDVSSQISHWLI